MFEQVKALVFDVFGTVVDWREGIAREAGPFLAQLGRGDIDAHGFADAWRARYQPAMEECRTGRRPFTRLDVLHRTQHEARRPLLHSPISRCNRATGCRRSLLQCCHSLKPPQSRSTACFMFGALMMTNFRNFLRSTSRCRVRGSGTSRGSPPGTRGCGGRSSAPTRPPSSSDRPVLTALPEGRP